MTDYTDTLKTRIDTLGDSIKNLTERRKALIEEWEDALKEAFEAETGLHEGDALEPTAEFIAFDNARGNDGDYWKYDGRQLVVQESVHTYAYDQTLRVGFGGVSTGGVPVHLVQRMRTAWLDKHKETA